MLSQTGLSRLPPSPSLYPHTQQKTTWIVKCYNYAIENDVFHFSVFNSFIKFFLYIFQFDTFRNLCVPLNKWVFTDYRDFNLLSMGADGLGLLHDGLLVLSSM